MLRYLPTLLLATLLLAGCDRESKSAGTPRVEQTASVSTEAPSRPATSPTPTPSPVPLGPASTYWIVNRGDIWILPADRPSQGIRLATRVRGPLASPYAGAAGYAGIVRRGAAFDVYTWSDEPTDDPHAAFGIYRWSSDTQRTQRVAAVADARADFRDPGMRVRPDGTAIAYATLEGIRVRTFASNEDALVVPRCGPKPEPGFRCAGELDPAWSADGRYLASRRAYWEVLVAFVTDLSTGSTSVTSPGFVSRTANPKQSEDMGDHLAWSPEGHRLCGANYRFSSPSDRIGIYDAGTKTTVEIPMAHPVAPFDRTSKVGILGCEWSAQGDIAVLTQDSEARTNTDVMLFGGDGSKRGSFFVGLEQPSLVTWLPNSSGILAEEVLRSTTRVEYRYHLFDLNGTKRTVEIDAGQVLAIVATR